MRCSDYKETCRSPFTSYPGAARATALCRLRLQGWQLSKPLLPAGDCGRGLPSPEGGGPDAACLTAWGLSVAALGAPRAPFSIQSPKSRPWMRSEGITNVGAPPSPAAAEPSGLGRQDNQEPALRPALPSRAATWAGTRSPDGERTRVGSWSERLV